MTGVKLQNGATGLHVRVKRAAVPTSTDTDRGDLFSPSAATTSPLRLASRQWGTPTRDKCASSSLTIGHEKIPPKLLIPDVNGDP